MTQDMDWQGKVALVTGGSSGIGLAVASALVARGANVVITGRNRDRLAQAADHQKSIEAVVASGSPEDHAAEVVKKALGKWGRLDLLVNNAGAGHPMPVDAYTADAIAAICAVNITTPSLLVKEAQASLRQTGGAIVNISTAVSRNAAPALAHYAATKAALEHLTRSWAIELAEAGIRVNAVAPGPVKTGALTGMMGLPPEAAEAVEATEAAQIPLGRRGLTEDLVPWILRLGSSGNEWLTGQIVTIDGGWSQRS